MTKEKYLEEDPTNDKYLKEKQATDTLTRRVNKWKTFLLN